MLSANGKFSVNLKNNHCCLNAILYHINSFWILND